jgi:hypothetical protein
MDEREFPMSIDSEKDPTKYFSVVGSAYVPEHHDEGHRRYVEQAISDERAGGVAGLWLVFYAVVIGLSVIANSGVGKWINVANLPN